LSKQNETETRNEEVISKGLKGFESKCQICIEKYNKDYLQFESTEQEINDTNSIIKRTVLLKIKQTYFMNIVFLESYLKK